MAKTKSASSCNKRCLRITYCYIEKEECIGPIRMLICMLCMRSCVYACVVYACIIYVCVVRAGCLCHARGATDLDCHPITGQCSCQPNVRGQACDECMVSIVLGVINNNNINFYTAHTPEIQINALYNANIMHNKIKYKKHTCNIILKLKSIYVIGKNLYT